MADTRALLHKFLTGTTDGDAVEAAILELEPDQVRDFAVRAMRTLLVHRAGLGVMLFAHGPESNSWPRTQRFDARDRALKAGEVMFKYTDGHSDDEEKVA